MDQNKIWGAAGLKYGPLLFLVYIIDVPKAIDHKAVPIIFADDTSILIISPNNIHFQNNLNIVVGQLNKWSNLICFP